MFKYILPGLILVNSVGFDNIIRGSRILYNGYYYFFPSNTIDDATLAEFKKLKEEEEIISNKLDNLQIEIQELNKKKNKED